MKLIVNADDFGYSKGVNLGIIEAHRAGVVTSTTTMVNMGGFEHAVQLARETPTLGVGIHLVLTCGAPVSHDVPSLTDEHGRFHRGYDYLGTTSPEDVERSCAAKSKSIWRRDLPRRTSTVIITSMLMQRFCRSFCAWHKNIGFRCAIRGGFKQGKGRSSRMC